MADRASTLAARLDELASALERAGAPAAGAAALLEHASLATLKAVALEHVVSSVPAAPRPARPAELPTAFRRAG
jgi:hypothetical protein